MLRNQLERKKYPVCPLWNVLRVIKEIMRGGKSSLCWIMPLSKERRNDRIGKSLFCSLKWIKTSWEKRQLDIIRRRYTTKYSCQSIKPNQINLLDLLIYRRYRGSGNMSVPWECIHQMPYSEKQWQWPVFSIVREKKKRWKRTL